MDFNLSADNKKLTEWLVFIIYIAILSFTMFHHELWADELHSWNIAKGSNGFFDMISNTKYEGHPPVWYVILWSISKFTHNLLYVKVVHLIIAVASIYLLLFFSPLPKLTKILIPFGYYFLFEYSVFSRNYAIGILLAFLLCIMLRKNFKNKIFAYYLLLFLLSNTHLLSTLLAASIHAYFLIELIEQKKNKMNILLNAVIGFMLMLPSVYFIFPPSSSEMNSHFWLDHWNVKQLITIVQAPLRSFLPLPAWWTYNFWNTEFLLELQTKISALKFINVFVSALLILAALFVLKNNIKSFILFVTNLLLTCIIGAVFSLTSARYAGFIFIGFIVSYWLYSYESSTAKAKSFLINCFLFFQLIAGVFIVAKDIKLPFSNSYRVDELVKEVPLNKMITTDYWTLNTLSAYEDKPYYCIDLQKQVSFLLWKDDVFTMLKDSSRYYNGVNNLFQQQKINQLYLISVNSPTLLQQLDNLLFKKYKVQLIDRQEGAIEKGSNLYLYRISL